MGSYLPKIASILAFYKEDTAISFLAFPKLPSSDNIMWVHNTHIPFYSWGDQDAYMGL